MIETLLWEVVYILMSLMIGYGASQLSVWFRNTEKKGDDFNDTIERMKDEIIGALKED